MLACLVARAATLVTHTEPPRLFAELGRHPRLFRSWLPFGGALLLRGALPRADTELAVLRTAWRCGCRYEWVQHALLAERAGLDEGRIAAVIGNPDDEGWTERQRLLLRAVDELHDGGRLAPETVGRLAEYLDDRQRIELCMLVGHYEMLAMVLLTGRVEPELTALARLRGRAAEVAAAWPADDGDVPPEPQPPEHAGVNAF